MTPFVHNEYLFAQAYLEQLLNERCDQEAERAFAETLSDWLSCRDTSSVATLLSSFVGPVLDTLGFVHSAGDGVGVVRLGASYQDAEPIAVCLAIGPTEAITGTFKGAFPVERLIRTMRNSGAAWGILTDGSVWRLYRRDDLQPYETHLEVDLSGALSGQGSDAVRLFRRFFSVSALAPEPAGEPAVEGFLRESSKTTRAIERHLQGHLDEVLRQITLGFVGGKEDQAISEVERSEVFKAGVFLLYRMVFLLYAESRHLLPVDDPAYRPHSLEALIEHAVSCFHGDSKDTDDIALWARLRNLCVWVDGGHRETAEEPFAIGEYDGELFDTAQQPYLSEHSLPNHAMAAALYQLTCMAVPKQPGRYHRIDYRDLSVRHLGSLYETLLEYRLFIAAEPMIARETGGKTQFLRQTGAIAKVGDVVIPKGDVYFSQSPDERKSSGSYYTPEDVVDYIVSNTVSKGLQDRWDAFEPQFRALLSAVETAATDAERERMRRYTDDELRAFVEREVLHYRVLDPAMGSGHFLVNALHRITNFVVETLNRTPWASEDLDSDPRLWRRRVVERCLHGVDVNPLATELAKLSLWLASAAEGKPLTFLDHHLKCGNSLYGTPLARLGILPKSKRKVDSPLFHHTREQFVQDLARLVDTISVEDSSAIAVVETKKETNKRATALSQRLRDVCNVWLATLFGMETIVTDDDLDRLNDALAQNRSVDAWEEYASRQPAIFEARAVSKRLRFFHWEVEFPETVHDGACQFDAVVANPPYVGTRANSAVQELFETAKCADLYAWIFERALTVTGANGNVGAIVPLSITFARQLAPLRAAILRRNGATRLANFDASRDGIFLPNGKVRNHQRATIVTLSAGPGLSRVETTDLLRWIGSERAHLIRSLSFSDISRIASVDAFPRFGRAGLAEFWIKASEHPNIGGMVYRSSPDDPREDDVKRDLHRVYIPDAIGYFVAALPFCFKETKISAYSFDTTWKRDVAMLALNSNVFYWLWCALGDGFDLTAENIHLMPVPQVGPGDPETVLLRDALLAATDSCKTTMRMNGREVANYNFNKRMDILLSIDAWIMKHVAQDLDLPRDIFAQYKSNSFLRPLDINALTAGAEDIDE